MDLIVADLQAMAEGGRIPQATYRKLREMILRLAATSPATIDRLTSPTSGPDPPATSPLRQCSSRDTGEVVAIERLRIVWVLMGVGGPRSPRSGR